MIDGLIFLAGILGLLLQMPDPHDCLNGPPDTPEDTDHLTHKSS